MTQNPTNTSVKTLTRSLAPERYTAPLAHTSMRTSSINILALTLIAIGCSTVEPEDVTIVVQSDQQTYLADSSTVTTILALNTSSVNLYYSQCMPIALEKYVGDEYVASHAFPLCECICETTLPPGESWQMEFMLYGIVTENGPMRVEPGATYRLRVLFFEENRLRKPLDIHMLRSNNFEFIVGGAV